MKDQTIESLPDNERKAALYHVEWTTDELGDEQAARDFVTLALKILGPQAKVDTRTLHNFRKRHGHFCFCGLPRNHALHQSGIADIDRKNV